MLERDAAREGESDSCFNRHRNFNETNRIRCSTEQVKLQKTVFIAWRKSGWMLRVRHRSLVIETSTTLSVVFVWLTSIPRLSCAALNTRMTSADSRNFDRRYESASSFEDDFPQVEGSVVDFVWGVLMGAILGVILLFWVRSMGHS